MVTLFRRGKCWWIQFRNEGRRVRESLKPENRKVAEELRLRREVELGQQRLGLVGVPAVAGAAVAVEPAKPVVDVAAARAEYEEWSTAHKRPKTILNDKARLESFFATVPGKALGEITTADVERLLTSAALKGRQPATLLRHREILHGFWRWAERQGHVDKNIVSAIPRPRLPERDPRFLSLDQVAELLKAVEGNLIAPVIATAVFAGLRREELCWLTWDDLELDRVPGILRVRAKTVKSESWQPKTQRDRKVPVSGRLLGILEAHRDAKKRAKSTWLFESPDGCRWDPENLGRSVREVLRPAKPLWNFLDLRHTFGSQLARKGVSLLKIAKLMGNSPAIASLHYINLVPEDMATEVEF